MQKRIAAVVVVVVIWCYICKQLGKTLDTSYPYMNLFD